jgi:hypothetical protein
MIFEKENDKRETKNKGGHDTIALGMPPSSHALITTILNLCIEDY